MSGVSVARLTDHFERWQGLRWLPLSLAALLAAILVNTSPSSTRFFPVAVVGASVLVVAERWISGYYERTFGRVREVRAKRIRHGVLRYAGIVPAAVAAVADVYLHPAVLLSGLVIGAAFLVFWTVSGRGRWHWPVLATAPIIASFAPVTGLVPPGRTALAVLLVITAAAELVGGVLDHRMLLAHIHEVHRGVHE